MCCRVVTHRLHCDARVLAFFVRGRTCVVNGFARPRPCCAEQDLEITPALRCTYGHGCCYMSARYYPSRCESLGESCVEFHEYVTRTGTTWVTMPRIIPVFDVPRERLLEEQRTFSVELAKIGGA